MQNGHMINLSRLILYLFAPLLITISLGSCSDASSSSGSSRNAYPQYTEPALALPTTGTVRRHSPKSGVAPLEVRTNSGSHYFVKLQDTITGQDILDVFIQGGRTIQIDVPLGTYTIKYASGDTWYGYEYHFGPKTIYSKADSTFRFYRDATGYSGYTITLYMVQHGNLRTERLNPSEF